jgi:murein DD-endopeptidase MepM/ murein hydrolase activator NlpD
MWLRAILRFLRNAAKPVSVFIIPHNGMPSLRFNLPVLFLLVFGAGWTVMTIWAGFVAGKHFDYYITKADNKVLRAKMSHISMQVEDGLAYLEMTKKTDKQLRKVLGMDMGALQGEEGVGGPPSADLTAFRNQLNAKAEEIREAELARSMRDMRDESARRLSSYSQITLYLADRHNNTRATPSIWPTQGNISSSYGYRIHPLRMVNDFHSGLDISNEAGTKIMSTADGVVRHSGWAYGYGMCLVVDHGFGYTTLYGHLSELGVKEGDQVKRGQLIGRMGSTGTSTGNHLHYEVWTGGVPRNPFPFLQGGGKQSSNFAGMFDGIFSGL